MASSYRERAGEGVSKLLSAVQVKASLDSVASRLSERRSSESNPDANHDAQKTVKQSDFDVLAKLVSGVVDNQLADRREFKHLVSTRKHVDELYEHLADDRLQAAKLNRDTNNAMKILLESTQGCIDVQNDRFADQAVINTAVNKRIDDVQDEFAMMMQMMRQLMESQSKNMQSVHGASQRVPAEVMRDLQEIEFDATKSLHGPIHFPSGYIQTGEEAESEAGDEEQEEAGAEAKADLLDRALQYAASGGLGSSSGSDNPTIYQQLWSSFWPGENRDVLQARHQRSIQTIAASTKARQSVPYQDDGKEHDRFTQSKKNFGL